MSASTINEAIERVRSKVVTGSIHLCQDVREQLVDELDQLQQFIRESNVAAFSAHLQRTTATVRVIVAELVAEMRGAPLTPRVF